MYQNHLSHFIDSTKKQSMFGVMPHIAEKQTRIDSALEFHLMLKELAPRAICFSTELESVPKCELVSDLMKLPYSVCWFEFVSDTDNELNAALCYECENGFMVASYYRQAGSKWFFGGLFNVTPQDDGVYVRCVVGAPDNPAVGFCAAVLHYVQAINCCNIKRTEHKPTPRQQSLRRTLGRQPLFSTWTLEIDLERTEREIPGESAGGHTTRRLHLCRGHARQHKPGQWCWVRAHVRGDKSAGVIHKDYATH